MTITERKTMENQAYMLISRINTHYEPEVSSSVMTLHGGTPTSVSSLKLCWMIFSPSKTTDDDVCIFQ